MISTNSLTEKENKWTCRASKQLFKSKWFSLQQDELTLPNGDDITYTYVKTAGYVTVVPVLEDGRIVMERIYRHTVRRTLLECPMGGLDGEQPETAARRELEEETGYIAEKTSTLGSFYGSTGISNEPFHVVVATHLRSGGKIQRENTEQIEVELIDHQTLQTIAESGEILNGPTTLALLLARPTIESYLKHAG